MLAKVTAEISDVCTCTCGHAGGLGDLNLGVVAIDQMVFDFFDAVLRKQIGKVCVVRQKVQGKELLVESQCADLGRTKLRRCSVRQRYSTYQTRNRCG